jgi:hypothetical protein
MGMFDYIKCEMPLPGLNEEVELQTKDTPTQYMDTYTITKEGRLIYNAYETVEVPLEQRPYYKPGMDPNSLMAMGGCIKRVPAERIDQNYHGYIYFCGRDSKGEWHDFRAKFTDGVCVKIESEG